VLCTSAPGCAGACVSRHAYITTEDDGCHVNMVHLIMSRQRVEADIVVLGLEIEAESANSSDEMPLHP